jgi:hypothetical protein
MSKEPSAKTSIENFVKRLSKAKALRPGSIMLRLTGKGGGDICLECSNGGVRVSKGLPKGAPVIEVMGEGRRILAILEGKKDGRVQFLAGGIRVRGNIRYLSDLAMELGILTRPI